MFDRQGRIAGDHILVYGLPLVVTILILNRSPFHLLITN